MTHDRLRFALVALALVVTAGVLGAGMDEAIELQSASLQDGPGNERPTLQIEPTNENITERNATTFLVHLGNQPWNDYPKYVVLRVWSPSHDDLGLKVNDEPPDVSFDQGVGWEFHHDLEPGRHVIYTVTVESDAEPGNYSIYAAGMFVEDGELTTDTKQANLSIETVPPPSLCERVIYWIVGLFGLFLGIIEWIIEHFKEVFVVLLTIIGVFAGVSQLLIALYGRERFLKGIRWPVRRVRGEQPRSGDPEQDEPK